MAAPTPTLFGAVVVGRSAIEATARVISLLDPALGIEERVGRQIASRIKSLGMQITQIKAGIDVEIARDQLGTEEEVDRLRKLVDVKSGRIEAAQAQADGLGIALRGEPNLTDVVSTALADSDFDVGRTAYGWLCDIAHARAPSLLDSMAPDYVDHGEPGARPIPMANFYEIPGWLALVTFRTMFERLAHYFGWDTWAWKGWDNRTMGKWLRARRESMVAFETWSAQQATLD